MPPAKDCHQSQIFWRKNTPVPMSFLTDFIYLAMQHLEHARFILHRGKLSPWTRVIHSCQVPRRPSALSLRALLTITSVALPLYPTTTKPNMLEKPVAFLTQIQRLSHQYFHLVVKPSS